MYGIIPARLNSTRLPKKALIVLKNKTLIQRVYENVIKNTILENLFVATNNKKIKDTVKSFGGNVIDTQDIHLNGTERCFEASNKINTENEDIILNIQCDEPTIDNEAINLIYDAFKHNSELKIVTLVSSNLLSNEINDPSIVKTQLDKNNFAIEFSRVCKKKNNYKHIGIYGFKKKTLEKLINLKPFFLDLLLPYSLNSFSQNIGVSKLTSSNTIRSHKIRIAKITICRRSIFF